MTLAHWSPLDIPKLWNVVLRQNFEIFMVNNLWWLAKLLSLEQVEVSFWTPCGLCGVRSSVCGATLACLCIEISCVAAVETGHTIISNQMG